MCEEDTYRLYNSMTTYTPNGLLRVTGIPQGCSDGGWISLCNDGTIDLNAPLLLCNEFGYRGLTDTIVYL